MNGVTELFQRLAEQDIRQPARLLRDVLDSLDVAAFIVDISDDERTIHWCNAEACRVFGYEPEEMTGESAAKLHVDAAHFETFGAQMRDAVEHGKAYRGRFWLRRKDGSRFASEHVVTPVRSYLGRSIVVSMLRPAKIGAKTLLPENYDRLSDREKEVFDLTAKGLSAKEVARKLKISPRTVEVHRARILGKCEVGSIRELMSSLYEAASRHGIST